MTYLFVTIVMCLAIIQVDYASSQFVNNSTNSTNITISPTVSATSVESSSTNSTSTSVITEVATTAKEGILKFSLLFENAVSKTISNGKNLLFAPVSILGILATLLLAAESDSKSQILSILGFSTEKNLTDKENLIHYAVRDLFGNFSSEGNINQAVKTNLNQAIFYTNGTKVKDKFVKLAQEFYRNEIFDVDFNEATLTANTINKWALNRTNGRISEIVESDALSIDTRLILVNTLFFDGEWAKPFLKNSSLSNFHLENSTVIKVKTMSNFGTVYLYQDTNYCALGLPYKGENTFMYILLPDKSKKLRNVLSQFKETDIQNIIYKSKKENEVMYMLPYMKLAKELDLNEVLPSLGLIDIFNPMKANLSGIADNLYVSKIVHKVSLAVTEAGSTGSAATSADITTRFPSKSVIVNRPFGFFLIHRPSGVISFWGSINYPTETADL